MNIYNAIMKAADRIQANPEQFSFMSCSRPDDCGTPGCALGWIGNCAGTKATIRDYAWQVSEEVLKIASPFDFYERMDRLAGIFNNWRSSASMCAKTMRLYAEMYHGNDKPTKALMPDWQTIATSPLIPDHVRSEEVA